MDDQQVGLGLDGLAHGGKGGIHGGGNAADLAVVFDLQSVHGAVVIGDFINLQGAIAVPHDILDTSACNRKPMTQSFGNDRLANFAAVSAIRALMNPLANDECCQAREMYYIDRWRGYYDINTGPRGGQTVAGEDTAVELSAVIAAAQKRDLDGPLLIRFQDILRHRVKSLCTAFDEAIARTVLRAGIAGCFPSR